MALILDTGVIYASLDRTDADHPACRELIAGAREPRVIPAPVLVEVEQLVSSRMHVGVFLALLQDVLDGAYQVEDLRLADYARVAEICDRYADSNVGFVDAAVMSIAERLNETKVATLDHRHFAILRPKHIKRLTLLPK